MNTTVNNEIREPNSVTEEKWAKIIDDGVLVLRTVRGNERDFIERAVQDLAKKMISVRAEQLSK